MPVLSASGIPIGIPGNSSIPAGERVIAWDDPMNEAQSMNDRLAKIVHVTLVVLYWFALLGLIGEQGDPKTANGTGVFLVMLVVVFGIWRVVRKQRLLRREARAVAASSDGPDAV
jgi:hypothetical protein